MVVQDNGESARSLRLDDVNEHVALHEPGDGGNAVGVRTFGLLAIDGSRYDDFEAVRAKQPHPGLHKAVRHIEVKIADEPGQFGIHHSREQGPGKNGIGCPHQITNDFRVSGVFGKVRNSTQDVGDVECVMARVRLLQLNDVDEVAVVKNESVSIFVQIKARVDETRGGHGCLVMHLFALRRWSLK